MVKRDGTAVFEVSWLLIRRVSLKRNLKEEKHGDQLTRTWRGASKVILARNIYLEYREL